MSSESAEGGCPACGGSIPSSYVYVVSTCFVCARPVRPSSRYGSSAPVFILLDVIGLLCCSIPSWLLYILDGLFGGLVSLLDGMGGHDHIRMGGRLRRGGRDQIVV